MAVAAVGTGMWPDFSRIDDIHQVETITKPIPEHNAAYERLLPVFVRVGQHQSEIGEMLANLGEE
jgi:xylulokinase